MALLSSAESQQHIWIGRAFFIWVSVFNLFVVSVFWSFIVDVFDGEQGKRLWRAGDSRGSNWDYTKGAAIRPNSVTPQRTRNDASPLQTWPSKLWTTPDHDKLTDLLLEMAAERLSLGADGVLLGQTGTLPNEASTIVATESPIDAISYHALHRKKGMCIVSLAGQYIPDELLQTCDKKAIIIAIDNPAFERSDRAAEITQEIIAATIAKCPQALVHTPQYPISAGSSAISNPGRMATAAFHLANALFQTACRFEELIQLTWSDCQRVGRTSSPSGSRARCSLGFNWFFCTSY